MNFDMELSHLHKAVELLKRYEKKDWQEVIKDGKFPAPISLHENVEYVRNILKDTVQFTSGKDDTYERIRELPKNADFFAFQKITNPSENIVPSHLVIDGFIKRRGMDYRYQVAPSPVPELRNRREDNTEVGRVPNATTSTDFTCHTDCTCHCEKD
jgi:hypothetical protein